MFCPVEMVRTGKRPVPQRIFPVIPPVISQLIPCYDFRLDSFTSVFACIAKARGIDENSLKMLVVQHIGPRQFGIFGEPRVNVLELKLVLDEKYPVKQSR